MPPSSSLLIAIMLLGTAAPSEENTRKRWSSFLGGRSFETRGAVQFTDDDRDVKSISPGGYVRISEGGWLRSGASYEIRAEANGSLSRTYKFGGLNRSMDGAAQAWAAAAILTLVRETGVNAGPRVDRFLRKGGPAAVLREVSEIHSDGSKKTYLHELVERGRLNEEQLRDVMRSARTLGSDGEKTALLIELWGRYQRPNLRESWFAVLGGVGSDGDKRHGLEQAIRSDPDAETLTSAAKLAGSMGSDGDKAAVLSAIGGNGRLTAPARRAWFRAVQTIGSDGDKAHVLAEAARSDLSAAEASQRAFFAAANTIGSDADRTALLTSILRSSKGSSSVLTSVTQAAKNIGSDGDKAAVLSRAAELEMTDPAARASFFAAVNTIGSDGDRAAVLRKVLKDPKLAPDAAVAAIDSAVAMGSDGEKASVLLLAAERHASTPAVRAALERALRSVQSDGDYRRVSAALLKRQL